MYKTKYPNIINYLENHYELILLDSDIQDLENLVGKDLEQLNKTS